MADNGGKKFERTLVAAGIRAEAAGRNPIFKAKTIDYYYLNGDGPRLTIQLDHQT